MRTFISVLIGMVAGLAAASRGYGLTDWEFWGIVIPILIVLNIVHYQLDKNK